jgi:glycosyltransferase involved in cell wall biosynthesis
METKVAKIAFINIYQKEVSRGAEVFVSELSRRLSQKYRVIVFSGNKSKQTRWPFVWRFYVDPDGISIFWFTVKLLPTLIKGNFDVIVPLNGGWQPAVVRLLTWITGKRMVIIGQSGMGWDDRNNLFSFPDIFVAITSEARRWAKASCPWVRSTYIPNGVNTNLFTPEGPTFKHGLSSPVVLTVAALTPSKQIKKTIEAVAQSAKASLLVVGKGPLEDTLIRYGKEKLGKRFKLVHANYEKMPEIYRSANCFTLCSVSSEAFGNVYVEALACNIPVVATDDSKRREIVGEAGLFVNPEKTDSYAAALTTALTKRWGNKPRNQSKMFDWKIIADSYERLFNSLL